MPVLLVSDAGLAGMAFVLVILLAEFGTIGTLFMPNTAGRTLAGIERERAARDSL